MKTLVSVELTFPYITTSPKSTILLIPMIPFKTPSYIPTKTWKIHAKAKGFNGANLEKQKLTIKDEKKRIKESDEKIPDEVMNRMISRVLFNVGVPLVTGLALLQMFSVVKENNLWQFPRWLPFLTTFITFGASTLGIAYGTLSTSWDIENKGSVLGFEEAKKNWVEMWEQDDSEDVGGS